MSHVTPKLFQNAKNDLKTLPKCQKRPQTLPKRSKLSNLNSKLSKNILYAFKTPVKMHKNTKTIAPSFKFHPKHTFSPGAPAYPIAAEMYIMK
jgi:hypothetical protein